MPSFVERLTGKRHQHTVPTPPSTAHSSTPNLLSSFGSNASASTLEGGGDAGTYAGADARNRDRPLNRSPAKHKRESSILSLASVTDLGANVRRSVSLRSHRTNTSAGSSFKQVGSPLRGGDSPKKRSEDDDDDTPSHFEDPSSQPRSHPRRKISLSQGLTRFRSIENLSNRNTAIYLDGAHQNNSPMLAPAHNAPSLGTRRPPPENLRTQSSFRGEVPPPATAPTTATTPNNPLSTTNSLIYTQIQETSAKRIATITYLRRLHAGDIFHFSTYHYTSQNLSQLPSLHAHKLGRRATNYFILGYSLPALLDMNSSTPLEYLKALSALLHEFETFQNLSGFDASGNTLSKTRMGAMFKSGMGLGGHRNNKARRASTVSASFGAPPTPSFDSLDTKQADLLGLPRQTSFGSSNTMATSPIGGNAEVTSPGAAIDLSSPINPTNHEFSFLMTPHLPYEPDFATTFGTLCDTLIDTYAKLLELITGPGDCGAQVGVEFGKADKAIRKVLVVNAVRELEESTRGGVRGEVAGLGRVVLGGLM